MEKLILNIETYEFSNDLLSCACFSYLKDIIRFVWTKVVQFRVRKDFSWWI